MNEPVGTASPISPVPADEVRETLDSLAAAVDEWMAATAEQFDPFRGPTVRKSTIRSKAFTEASMYLYVAETVGDGASGPIKDLCIRRANDEAYYRQLRRTPAELPKVGYPLAFLDTLGKLEEDARCTLETVLEWPETQAAGQMPSRQLDFWHVCTMVGYEDHGIDYRALFDHGYVNRHLNPATVGQQDTFGLTHEILYYHNLGSRHDAFPDDPLEYEYPSVFVGAILRYMVEGHVDLVGELLLCGVLQRQLDSNFIRFVLGWLLDHVEEGSLAFPTDDTSELQAFVGPDVSEWTGEGLTWRCNYHPTVVASILARVVHDAWPELQQSGDQRDLNHAEAGNDLLALGTVFASFADYKLERGARQLHDLAGTPIAEEYDDVVRHAVRYLERQCQPDGTYGSWLDKRLVFTNSNESHTNEQFNEELLEPLSEICSEAVAAHDLTTPSSPSDR